MILATGSGLVLAADPPGTITTVAGGGIGDGGPAISAGLYNPSGVAVDASGNLFIADSNNSRIRKVAADGTITTVAGTGAYGFSGDGGPATSARLYYPTGVAVDTSGNLFIADLSNHRIRRVAADGTITTVAGTGAGAFSGDGGPATSARLSRPWGVAVDASGNVFIADYGNHRIRKVAADGTITTVAGGGLFSGDGGPATSAGLYYPTGVAVDASGNLFIADDGNHRIRKVAADGTITTVAGTGAGGFSGDGGPATSATLYSPRGVAVDASGTLFIADMYNHRIRKVREDGTITTVAGTGAYGFAGDGGPATSATLYGPQDVAVDASGNRFIADTENNRIRKVSPDGTITTVAGTGSPILSGDGGPATSATLYSPRGVAVDASGNLFIADSNNSRIRKVAADGTITTVAGTGAGAFSGDGGPATSAGLAYPRGVAVDASGNLFIADMYNHRIRKVAADGTITTVAGTGSPILSGDGGPATSAGLYYPMGVAVDASGTLFIADMYNHRIRKVREDGTITTVAGTGAGGFSGDGGPATSATLYGPFGVAVDASGTLFIADMYNHRIRKVAADGTITTVAGTGAGAFSGDGGPATSAALYYPHGVAVDGSGNLFIADYGNSRVRKVAAEAQGNIVAPAAIAQECDAEDGATVNFVFDVVPGPADLLRVRDMTGSRTLLEVASALQQQYGVGPVVFPHGASTVLIELLQGTTVLASAEFVVQVEDTTAPALAGCEPRTIELAGPVTTLTAALLGVTADDACDPVPTVTLAPEALPLGTTSVTATARDATGNTTACVFDVTVVDTMAPSFTVWPADIERECEEGGALVSFDVLAEDLSGEVTIACEDQDGNPIDPSGTRFHAGAHTVTCTATDPSGNEAAWSFRVTVVDTVAPAIVCPDDITVGNDPGECFAYVAFDVAVTDECDDDVPVACEAPWGPVSSGDAFPIGTTAVTCTARDHSGNETSCTFHVTVEDREAPALLCPAEATLVTDCAGSPLTIAPGDLGVSATDNCDPDPVVTCSPTALGPGTTDVTCTARDDDGNEATCTLAVTVLKGPLECRFLRPLEAGRHHRCGRDGRREKDRGRHKDVDNLIRPGQTVPIKLRVTCHNVFDPGATVTLDEVVRIDGNGTPIGNDLLEEDDGPCDEDNVFRLRGESYRYNLSTRGWPTTRGDRFRVTVRVAKAGHVDALCETVLRNK